MAEHKGPAYLRTTRPATALLYKQDEAFPVGGSKVLKKSGGDAALVVAAGITVHEALKAYDLLGKDGVAVSIVDAYSVQPLDRETIVREAAAAGGKVVVVEDHFAAGGLGDAVASALAGRARIVHLAVRELPRSGKPEELLDKYGISARHIVEAVKSLMR